MESDSKCPVSVPVRETFATRPEGEPSKSGVKCRTWGCCTTCGRWFAVRRSEFNAKGGAVRCSPKCSARPLPLEVGQRFGRLVITGLREASRWPCRCDCGATTTVLASAMKRGNTLSCGCLATETKRRARTHGGASDGMTDPTYRTWKGMKERCAASSRANPRFSNYAGRGITVCDRWHEFENFLTDMGRKPSHRHSIDRIDNNRGYEPGNCRWATRAEQNGNTRRRHLSAEEADAVRKLVASGVACHRVATFMRCSRGTVHNAIHRLGRFATL